MVLTVILTIMLNCVNWRISEATCLMNEIRSNRAGDVSAYLIGIAHLEGWDLQPAPIFGAAPELINYQKKFWKNYFDSIFVGVPTSN